MVNVSASRLMTTPLNFIFAPFGMDCMLAVRALVACVSWACPKASGVTAERQIKLTTRTNALYFALRLILMLVSFGIAKERHRALQWVLSGEFADLEGESSLT